MRARARRIELDGDAGVEDFPAAAEIVEHRESAPARCPSLQKSLRPVERRRARGHAPPARAGGEHAVARRQARMQRLHHRAEVLLQPRRFRRGDRERVAARGAPVRAAARPPRRRRSCRASTCSASRAGSAAGSSRGPSRASISKPTTYASRSARPDAPASSAAASAAGDERRARMRERHETHVVEVERVRGVPFASAASATAGAQSPSPGSGTGRRRRPATTRCTTGRRARPRRPTSRRRCRAPRAPPLARGRRGAALDGEWPSVTRATDADGGHEALLDPDVVERGFAVGADSVTFATMTRARSREAPSARLGSDRGVARCASRAPPPRGPRRARSASADRRSSRIARCPSR